MTPSEFIEKYSAFARASMQLTGVPASVSLAQGALETGWGKAAIGNNLFGIKCGMGWTGKHQLVITTEYHNDATHKYPQILKLQQVAVGRWKYTVKDYFRDYDSPEESFTDHGKFLTENKRYAKAFEVKHDGNLFAEAIAAAGYATAPDYAMQLKSIIRKYNLTQFDLPIEPAV